MLEATHRPGAGRLRLTAGLKAEYNDFTQWEFMPSVRTAWQPRENITVWAAWSRAARIPSRFENDQMLTFAAPGFTGRILPSPALESETLHASEVGWRWRGSHDLHVDATYFHHHYSRLVTNVTQPVAQPPGTDSTLDNQGGGTARGGELSVVWRPLANWQWQLAYTHLDMHLSVAPGSSDTSLVEIPGQSPRHQLSLRASWNLARNLEVDLWFRAVGKLSQPNRLVPAYETVDLRVGRQLGQGWEITLVGQNLLTSSHPEFRFFTVRAAVPRGWYLRLERRR